MHTTQDLALPALAFVTERPEAKLVDIEKALGVPRIQAGRTIRALMDEGKVRRNEETRQYFAI
jgi:DNA-binding IclR family transcriptional regulator